MGRLRPPQEQISIRHALGVAFEGSPGPPKPAVGCRGSGANGVVFPEPYRGLPCAAAVVMFVVDPVRAFPGRDALVEPAEPPRGLRFRVEPFRLEAWFVRTGSAGGV